MADSVRMLGPTVTPRYIRPRDMTDGGWETLLHVAATHGSTGVVRYLLRLMCPNLVDEEGLGPIHLAASHGHTQVRVRQVLYEVITELL